MSFRAGQQQETTDTHSHNLANVTGAINNLFFTFITLFSTVITVNTFTSCCMQTFVVKCTAQKKDRIGLHSNATEKGKKNRTLIYFLAKAKLLASFFLLHEK